jgi:ubiquinone/menaquinone biosynthesis C-methylase UbiE
VALYSMGDAGELARATDELVAVIRAWADPAGRRVVDLGCGIGRVALALEGEAAAVTGVDVSAGMVAAARARAPAGSITRFAVGNGRDLAMLEDASADLVLAADSWPFVVRGGEAIVAGLVAEVARVLAPGGDFLVFNWSYRGDLTWDVSDAEALAAAHGFDLLRAGERPFAIWDGIGFHLRRRE